MSRIAKLSMNGPLLQAGTSDGNKRLALIFNIIAAFQCPSIVNSYNRSGPLGRRRILSEMLKAATYSMTQ
jgi:hypothetical protein